jgi:hypothetical protein
MYTPLEEQPSKIHIGIYITSVFILGVFCVIDLALHEWFDYCFWNIGLVYATSIFNESSLASAYTTCDDNRENIEMICPNACSNIQHFEIAGGMMITMSVFSLIGLILLAIMHIVLLCGKKINYRFAWLIMFVPFLTYLGGLVIYCAIANTVNLQTYYGPSFDMKGGMIFAIIIIIFMAVNLVHGIIFTRRYLI